MYYSNNHSWRQINSIILIVLMLFQSTGIALATSTDENEDKSDRHTVVVRKGPRTINPFEPPLILSDSPSDIEISAARLFPEALTPVGFSKSNYENSDLARAMKSYKSGQGRDVEALIRFTEDHPESRWTPSVYLNLGLLQFDKGYFSDALKYWNAAWMLSKNERSLPQERVANRAISELTFLKARLGRVKEVEKHLKEVRTRSFTGSDEERIIQAQEALWCEKNRPEIAFRCGPLALGSIAKKKTNSDISPVLEKARSTSMGTNLLQLRDWSTKMGLNYQPAKRTKGAAVLVPSVVHWKVGHFAAIIAREGKKYQVKDPTFGTDENLWVTREVIDSESDGYFLIPPDQIAQGWNVIPDEEAKTVWGKGDVGSRDDNQMFNLSPKYHMGPEGCGGMARASIYGMQVTTNFVDVPLSYSPPVGPDMEFRINYNYLETNQPSTFTFPNLGSNWKFNWVSYLTVDGSQNVTVAVRNGGSEKFAYTGNPDPYYPDMISQATITKVATNHFERKLPDGTIEVFNQNDGAGRIFMTEVIDPQGNSALITYDTNFRVTAITDSLGQVTSLSYVSDTIGNVGYYKIAQISDPFSRTCSFAYDPATTTKLVSITDVIGLTSKFSYAATSSFITVLETPYGRTTFYNYTPVPSELSRPSRGIRVTFPDGTGSVVEGFIAFQYKTHYWDREAVARYPSDPGEKIYSHSVNTDWVYKGPLEWTLIAVPWHVKSPLESEITYNYANSSQSDIGWRMDPGPGSINKPISISRQLDNGNTQTYTYEYNELGHPTKEVDPIGRTISLTYANNKIDVLEIRQTRGSNNDLLQHWEYNSAHLPLVAIDGSGRETDFTYNSLGQLLTVTDANNDVTTLSYDTDGYLEEVDGPLTGSNDKSTLTYDSYGRVYQMTDSEGYTLTFSYDDANRLTQVSFPDGSNTQTVYNRLDAVQKKDRIGRWTTNLYDSLQQLVSTTDPQGRRTTYRWCSCGAMASLIDGAGHETQWHHDLQGRVVQKEYADGTTLSYEYENNTSRLKSRTDALGQTTNYSYNIDNTLEQISYTNVVNPTSSVLATWDPNYRRIKTIQNNWGTLTYNYNAFITDPFGTPTTGGGMLASVTNNVIANSDITYSYDSLGRITNRSIDGSNNSIAWVYDAASRVLSETNALGLFDYTFVGESTAGGDIGSDRLSQIDYPNGQVTKYDYFNNLGDHRLKQISNKKSSGGILSEFAYKYNPEGEILYWQQRQGRRNIFYNLAYDRAGQLISAVAGSGSPVAPPANEFKYTYDPAANRTSVQTASLHTVRVGGTKSTGDTLTIKIKNKGLDGGEKNIDYTVQPSDTLSGIASEIAASITADEVMQAIGINAFADGTAIHIRSVSPNSTVCDSSVSGGSTETLTFGDYTNGIENAIIGGAITVSDQLTITVKDEALTGGAKSVSYIVQSGDTLTNIASGLRDAINNDTDLQSLGVTASSASAVVSIASASENITSFEQSVSSGATETIELSSNVNAIEILEIDGVKSTSDVLTLTIFDEGLSGGSQSVSYTVQSSDSIEDIVAGLRNAINANSDLSNAGISSTSSGKRVKIKSNSPFKTVYRASTNSGATETMNLGPERKATQTALVRGSVTANDIITITVHDQGLSGGSKSVGYTVQAGNSLSDIAAGLATAVNNDSDLQALSVTASSTGVVLFLTSESLDTTTYTELASSSASEFLALSSNIGVLRESPNEVNELMALSPGGLTNVESRTSKPVILLQPGEIVPSSNFSSIKSTVLSIQVVLPNSTTFGTSVSGGATETLQLGVNVNGETTISVGGSKTTNDIVTVIVNDVRLSGGQKAINYTVQSGDDLISIAKGLVDALLSDTDMQEIGLSARSIEPASGDNTLQITGNIQIAGGRNTVDVTAKDADSNVKTNGYKILVSRTSYTKSASSAATVDIELGKNRDGNMSATVTGSATVNDEITLTTYNPVQTHGPISISYTVQAGDSLTDIATALRNAINADTGMQELGLSADSSGVIINITASSPGKRACTFDANGNMTSDGINTYEWDAENRLVRINYAGTQNYSQFELDPLGRSVKIEEVSGGSTTSTKLFVWCGDARCEERESSGVLAKQFFTLGQRNASTNNYYTTDHLWSIREILDGTATVQTQNSYAPFGNKARQQGSFTPDFDFASYYAHPRSGLNLTYFRVYNPDIARWLSREPLGSAPSSDSFQTPESWSGPNLYGYVWNNPIGFVDPFGLSGLTPSQISNRLQTHFNTTLIHANMWINLFGVHGAAFLLGASTGLNQEVIAGNIVDVIFKKMVSADPCLRGSVKITPTGTRGPDVYSPTLGRWWDVTTQGDAQRHFSRYESSYGVGRLYLYQFHRQGGMHF